MKNSSNYTGYPRRRYLKSKSTYEEEKKMKKREIRITVCALLFFIAALIKTVFPGYAVSVKDSLLKALSDDFDYKAAVAYIGEVFSGEKSIGKPVKDLYVSVFGEKKDENIETVTENTGKSQTQNSVKQIEAAADIDETENMEEAVTTGSFTNYGQNTDQSDVSYDQAMVDAFIEEQTQYDGYDIPENVLCSVPELGFDYLCPLSGTVTSDFGYRVHPVEGTVKFHFGTDIANYEGESILAFADGVVKSAGESSSYGKYVAIEHEGGVVTHYAHCSKIIAEEGETVVKGEKIAEVGCTGNATGPCLHFVIIVDGMYVDPEFYVSWT